MSILVLGGSGGGGGGGRAEVNSLYTSRPLAFPETRGEEFQHWRMLKPNVTLHPPAAPTHLVINHKVDETLLKAASTTKGQDSPRARVSLS